MVGQLKESKEERKKRNVAERFPVVSQYLFLVSLGKLNKEATC